MSLATRCSACGTVFRVVQDQLKVSEGWVRCGRCNEVFNALQGLFDLERDTPPDADSGAHGDGSDPSTGTALTRSSEVDRTAAPSETHLLVDANDARAMHAQDAGQHSTPAGRVNERDRLEFPDAQFDSDMLVDDTIQLQMPQSERESTPTVRGNTADDTNGQPAFITHAQQRARWRTPAMRLVQASLTVTLTAGLALQGIHHFRDVIAARWTDTAPVLIAWCVAIDCKVEAPSRVDDVLVESTALTRSNDTEAFKLALVLRNRGATVLKLPWIDLTLTDTSGQLVARKMLSPRDFRAVSTVMPPGGESALQLILSSGDARVTGYTVEVFYP